MDKNSVPLDCVQHFRASELHAHICSQGAGCQVTSGLKSTWSLFPIIVKEIRTSDKEAETHIFRGLGGNNSQTVDKDLNFYNERPLGI